MCPKLSMLFLVLLAEVESVPFQYGGTLAANGSFATPSESTVYR